MAEVPGREKSPIPAWQGTGSERDMRGEACRRVLQKEIPGTEASKSEIPADTMLKGRSEGLRS